MNDIVININSFLTELSSLDYNEISLVIHNKSTNEFEFIQSGKVIVGSTIKDYYYPPNWKFSILLPGDLSLLIDSMAEIVRGSYEKQFKELFLVPSKGKFDILIPSAPILNIATGPRLLREVKFYTINYEWLSRFILKTYSKSSASLLKLLKYGNKNFTN